jgi:putative sigma-54 modulation protein
LQLDIIGKQFKVVPRLRAHIESHLEKLNRYDRQIISAHVVLKTQKFHNEAEVTVKSSHFEFFGHGTTDDNMFSAVDLAIHRVEAQLKKHREKFKKLKKQNQRRRGAMNRSLKAAHPEIVGSEVYAPKPLTTEEASLQLDSSDKDFIVFRSAQSKKINIMYKRSDGNHSLVEPEV